MMGGETDRHVWEIPPGPQTGYTHRRDHDLRKEQPTSVLHLRRPVRVKVSFRVLGPPLRENARYHFPPLRHQRHFG